MSIGTHRRAPTAELGAGGGASVVDVDVVEMRSDSRAVFSTTSILSGSKRSGGEKKRPDVASVRNS